MAQLLLMPEVSGRRAANTLTRTRPTLLTLLNDILDLQGEAGKLELKPSAFDPRGIIEEVAVVCRIGCSQAAESHYQWHARLASVTGPIDAAPDTDQSDQAIKFTQQGSIRVEAREIEREGAWAWLELAVIDSGMGIAPEKRPLLFKPFSQLDSSATRQFGGTGLGLSIVRSLAELMGGEAGVESQPGQGARFWVESAEPLRDDEESGGRVRLPWLPPRFGGGQVLVVEDNPTNRKVVEAMLRKLNIRAPASKMVSLPSSPSGTDAPDLVLMDIQMPVMDGPGDDPDSPVGSGNRPAPTADHCLTAGAFEEDRQQCPRLMDDYGRFTNLKDLENAGQMEAPAVASEPVRRSVR
jgi:CheY-like chemotaxis protein